MEQGAEHRKVNTLYLQLIYNQHTLSAEFLSAVACSSGGFATGKLLEAMYQVLNPLFSNAVIHGATVLILSFMR